MSGRARDPHSYGTDNRVQVRHVALDLTADFSARVLRGTVTLWLEGEGETLDLDTRDLVVTAVTDARGAPVPFRLGEPDPVLGSPLRLALAGRPASVEIAYATSPLAKGLSWLFGDQTAGGEPFLFSQGHAIETRSFIPLVDSPSARVTYEARIAVPAGLTALMSAARVGRERRGAEEVFSFHMREPIAPYLIALAVGNITERVVGPRTSVFAEPEVIDAAAEEFADLERIVLAAEELLGPYGWERFDILVMPPSFPYGGMENPRLVFVSPSLIARDRSLVTVLVHELAHAWAGNLVTNATWSDFWINEGTTVYLELRLNEVLWGRERAELLAHIGFLELSRAVGRMGESSGDTRLVCDLRGRDPAEGVTAVPYLKGAAFFWRLEALVGRERLDRFLRGWFERHAFRSVVTEQLVTELREQLLTEVELAELELEDWLLGTGLRPDAAPPPSSIASRVALLTRQVSTLAADDLNSGGPADLNPGGGAMPRDLAAVRNPGRVDLRSPSASVGGDQSVGEGVDADPTSSPSPDDDSPGGLAGLGNLGVHANRLFLEALLDSPPARSVLDAVGAVTGVASSENAELAMLWLRLRLRTGDPTAESAVREFGAKHGRLKYLRPLLLDLAAREPARALEVYATLRSRYHPLVQAALDRALDSV